MLKYLHDAAPKDLTVLPSPIASTAARGLQPNQIKSNRIGCRESKRYGAQHHYGLQAKNLGKNTSGQKTLPCAFRLAYTREREKGAAKTTCHNSDLGARCVLNGKQQPRHAREKLQHYDTQAWLVPACSSNTVHLRSTRTNIAERYIHTTARFKKILFHHRQTKTPSRESKTPTI